MIHWGSDGRFLNPSGKTIIIFVPYNKELINFMLNIWSELIEAFNGKACTYFNSTFFMSYGKLRKNFEKSLFSVMRKY